MGIKNIIRLLTILLAVLIILSLPKCSIFAQERNVAGGASGVVDSMAAEKLGANQNSNCGGNVDVFVTTWCTYCGAYKNGRTLKKPWTMSCGDGTLSVTPRWANGNEPSVPYCKWSCTNGETGQASGAGCESQAKSACCKNCSVGPEKKFCACGIDGKAHCYFESVLKKAGVTGTQECKQSQYCSNLKCGQASPTPSAKPSPSATPAAKPPTRPSPSKAPEGKCKDPAKPKLCQGDRGPQNFRCCLVDQECKFNGGLIDCVAPAPSASATASPLSSSEPYDVCIICEDGVCRVNCSADPSICCIKYKAECEGDPACTQQPTASAASSAKPPARPSASATTSRGKCKDPNKPKLCQGRFGDLNFRCCLADQECKFTGRLIDCVAPADPADAAAFESS